MRTLLLGLFSLWLAVGLAACGSGNHAASLMPTSNVVFIRAGVAGSAGAQERDHLSPRLRVFGHNGFDSTGNDSIVLMKNDGTGTTTLTNQLNIVGSVQLSWDGAKAVFMAEDNHTYLQIYYLDLSNLRKIKPVQVTTSPEDHVAPRFSPDNSTIIFYKFVPAQNLAQVFTVSASGGLESQIATPNLAAYFPTYTPDGGKIVFAAYDPASDSQTIRMMNANGSRLTTITHAGNDYDEMPSVSPDGKSVVFDRWSAATTQADVFAVGINGSTLKQLTTGGSGWGPVWVNDRIVYCFDGKIWAMSPDGTGQIALTPSDKNDYWFWD